MAPRGNGFDNRGRGRGRGRGAPSFRGQPGRGQSNRGRRRGGSYPVYNNLDVIDVDIQQYVDDTPASSYSFPASRGRGGGGYRGRGRGRGTSTPLNLQVFNSGRPAPPPRREDDFNLTTRAGRGIGREPSRGLGARYNPNLPLSKLLALDRPYLQPINFVRAQLTPVLFEREEELIESHEFKEPENHIPTAEQVSRVFSHHEAQPPRESFFQDPAVDLFADAASEPVVTVDFGSLHKLLDGTSIPPVDAQPQSTMRSKPVTPERAEGTSVFHTIMQRLSISTNEPLYEVVSEKPEGSAEKNEEQTISLTDQAIATIQEGPQEEEQDRQPLFVMDSKPDEPSRMQEKLAYTTTTSDTQALGSQPPDDEELIVYVAPHPRSGRTTPGISNSTQSRVAPFSDPTRLLASRPRDSSGNVSPTQAEEDSLALSPRAVLTERIVQFSSPSSSHSIDKSAEIDREPTASPRSRRLTKRDRQKRSAQRKGGRRRSFGILGAMLEERHLHEVELLQEKRSRREGSDIDWGDDDSDSDAPRQVDNENLEIERVSTGLGGMQIDEDLDFNAMKSFVRSMSSRGMEHVTIDDINDMVKLRLEDEEDEESSSESEEHDVEADAILKAEEEGLIGESNGAPISDTEDEDEDEDGDTSTDDETPIQNFQARLTKVRQSAKAKGKEKIKETAFSAAQESPGSLFDGRMSKLRGRGNQQEEVSDDDDDTDDSEEFDPEFTWADEDEECIADLQELLDDKDTLMSDRKHRKALFKSVLNGDFAVAPAKKRRDYGKDLPPDLLEQWEKDRARKAENKRKRAAARLEAALDPFAKHKGGKKGRKAMLRAARLAEEAREDAPPNAKPDMVQIVGQFREYLNNISITHPMALPPMDKVSRARVHEVAAAFGLKSQSKGKGATRYTTIIKTSRSGIRINERKIQRILRSGGDWGFTRPGNPGGGRGKGSGAPKHKEGDEVGKEAPKISEGNIGFKMLASMGWAEGERIGVSGGLDAPITAIIKHSKLGLGATR